MRLQHRAVRRVAMIALGTVGAVLTAPVAAINVYVRAAPYTETMPDGTSKTMWGYRVGATRGDVTGGGPSSRPLSPGAAIRVPHDDSVLEVTLINNLPVPTSFVLHGHNTSMAPVFTDAAGTPCSPPAPGTTVPDMAALQAFRNCRVRSFAKEAPPRPVNSNGNTALDVVYTYTNVKAGTYLYQSGTMPQIQVQMGLYGVVRKDAPPPLTPGRNAYPNVSYDNELTILLSEVDPALHEAVAAGTLNTSTLAYDPKFFRLHSYRPTTGNCTTAAPSGCITQPDPLTEQSQPPQRAQGSVQIEPGQRQLVRAVNAGIQSRVLELIDGHWYLVAEDGNKFPYPREQYSALLPAAKTADLWFTPTLGAVGTSQLDRQLTIFDRRMALTNNNADPSGGQLIRLNLSTGGTLPDPPNVSACATTGTQGTAYACTASSTAKSPTFSLEQAPAGMTIDATSGAIAWTPNNAQAWKPLVGQTASNPVQVRVTAGNGRYNSASFNVAVTNKNDAPVAANDSVPVRGGVATFAVASLLANDSDPDGDPLGGFAIVTPPAIGTLANSNGTLTYNANGNLPASGSEQRTFTYTVSDGSLLSSAATVTLTVFANSAPVAVDDVVSRAVAATTPTFIDVLANDYDVDGNLNVASLAIFGSPNRGGTATVVSAGCPNPTRPCISYTPPANFLGTEAITYTVSDSLGATSAAATTRVNVQ